MSFKDLKPLRINHTDLAKVPDISEPASMSSPLPF